MCDNLPHASSGMAGSGLDTGLVVSVAIPSSAGFAGGPAASCISLLVLLAEAELELDFFRDRGRVSARVRNHAWSGWNSS